MLLCLVNNVSVEAFINSLKVLLSALAHDLSTRTPFASGQAKGQSSALLPPLLIHSF